MVRWLVGAPFKLLVWALAAVGGFTLVLMAMIATPLVRPPEQVSISAARKSIDFSGLPAIERFQARDGT